MKPLNIKIEKSRVERDNKDSSMEAYHEVIKLFDPHFVETIKSSKRYYTPTENSSEVNK